VAKVGHQYITTVETPIQASITAHQLVGLDKDGCVMSAWPYPGDDRRWPVHNPSAVCHCKSE
jgi:hypothetical protein